MRPLLVSLALLLLALCRYDHIPTYRTEWIEGDAYMVDLMVAAESVLSGTPVEQLEKVANAGPDAMKALSNGVICALDPDNGLMPEDAKELLYEKETPDETAQADVNTVTDEIAKCFCKDKYVLVYCAALKYKTEKLKDAVQPTKCLTEAVAELWKYRYASYEESRKFVIREGKTNMLKQFFNRNATVISVWANRWNPRIFCAVRNTSIEAELRVLYTLTLSYYTVEDALEREFFVEVGRKESCGTDAFREFNSSPFGRCICAFEKGGITYCILRAVSQLLEEKGTLNCETVKFDTTKVPASIPEMLPRKITTTTTTTTTSTPAPTTTEESRGVSTTTTTSTPAPTTTGGSKGDTNSEDKTGGAATSSQLLATLAAAAAMLLMRH